MIPAISKARFRQVRKKDVNIMIAFAASFLLNGVPPIVCETVLEEVVTTIKKKMAIVL